MSYRVPPYAHFRLVHDEAVLLDTRSDAYFALNPSGAVVWSVLADGRSEESAADDLAGQFAVTPETVRADVAAVIEELLARGLLERIAE